MRLKTFLNYTLQLGILAFGSLIVAVATPFFYEHYESWAKGPTIAEGLNLEIHQADFDRGLAFYGKVDLSPEDRRKELQNFGVRELLNQEAMIEGTDKDPAFIAEMENYRKYRLAMRQVDKKIGDIQKHMPLSQEEIDAYPNPGNKLTREEVRAKALTDKQAAFSKKYLDDKWKNAGVIIHKENFK